jgi:hypothetical protein
MLDPVEEPFDAVARAVEHRAEARFPVAVNHCRDVRGSTDGFDAATQPIRIVGFVGQEDGVGMQPAEQLFGNRTITRLARCETNSSGKPRASVSAWILVVSPPRERPIQRSGWLFLS